MYKLVFSLIAVTLFISCEKAIVESPESVKKISCVLLTQETLFNNIPSKVINQYDSYFNLEKSETIVSNKTTSTITVKNALNNKNRPNSSVYKNEKDVTLKTITNEYTDNNTLKKQTIEYPAGSATLKEISEYNAAGKLVHYVAKRLSAANDIERISTYNQSNLLTREETLTNNQRTKLIENTYNEKDKLLKSTTTLANAKSFIEYTYNDKAQVIKTTTDLGVITEYKYSDLLIELVSKMNNKITKTEKRELDKSGNVLKISSSNDGVNFVILEERQYFPDNKLQRKISRTFIPGSNTQTIIANDVTYDTHGNATKYLSYSILTGELILTETYTYACNQN